MKYSPSPWHYNGDGSDGVIGDAQGFYVCYLDGNGRDDKSCSANARLIMHAPELLQALKACCERMRSDDSAGGEARMQGRALIAKVEGDEET